MPAADFGLGAEARGVTRGPRGPLATQPPWAPGKGGKGVEQGFPIGAPLGLHVGFGLGKGVGLQL